MNKKQLIVAWVMGILSAILLFRLFGSPNELYLLRDLPPWRASALSRLSVILIIGSLLIYSLRNKKK